MARNPFDHLSDEDLFLSLKESAREYLFQARKYDLMDSSDYMLDRRDGLIQGIKPENLGYNDFYVQNAFDDETDPSCFLRVFNAISSRALNGELLHPQLNGFILSVKLLNEFQLCTSDGGEIDVANIFARKALTLFKQPVPGRWRIFFGSYGLAPH